MENTSFFGKVKKWTFRIIIIAVLGTLAVVFTLGSLTYSEGFIIGTLNNFSKKGVIFKTYEGELNVVHANSINEITDQNLWAFSVNKNIKKSVLEAIETSLEEDKKGKFYYEEKFWKTPWSGDTKYYVYDVEILD